MLVVRINQIRRRVMEIEGIIDMGEILLDGAAENIILEKEMIPVRGEISG